MKQVFFYYKKLLIKILSTTLDELEMNIVRLNKQNIAVTVDNLGEFVYSESEAYNATYHIIKVIERINVLNP